MNSQELIAELETERTRIDNALIALRGNNTRNVRTVSRGHNVATTGQRHLTAAAKKRISDMMKLRWKERKAGKAKLNVVSGKKAA